MSEVYRAQISLIVEMPADSIEEAKDKFGVVGDVVRAGDKDHGYTVTQDRVLWVVPKGAGSGLETKTT